MAIGTVLDPGAIMIRKHGDGTGRPKGNVTKDDRARDPRTESRVIVIINRLTVDGRDFFLPEPVTELRDAILEAIRAGGGYVTIPPLNSGKGIDILFSPGMPVSWAQITMGNDPADDDSAEPATPHPVNDSYDAL